jgi:hypothetical protein
MGYAQVGWIKREARIHRPLVETLRFFHPTYWSDELKFAALEISSAALMLGGKQQKYSIH